MIALRAEAVRIALSVRRRSGLAGESELSKVADLPPSQRTPASTRELLRNLSLHYPTGP